MRLKIRLLLLYTCVGVTVLAVVGSVLFVQVRNNRSADLEQEFQNQLMHLDFALTNLIEEAKSDVTQLSENEIVRTTDDEDFTSFLNANESTFEYNIGETEQSIIDILNSYMTTHSYVNSVYMGRENGTFVRSHPRASPTQYDPRERPWYILGKENPGQVMITEPYESVTTTDINIGVVTTLVGDNGEVYGVLGADITLNDLTDYMSDFEIGYQGHMLLTDENGTIVAFSDSQFLFENIETLLGDTTTDIMSQSNGVMTVETESGSFYLYLYTSPELGWKLAVMAPTGVVNGVIQGPVFIALFGLFIALALLSLLTFLGLNISVINPLKRLSEVTLDIANRGDLSRKTGINAKNEIGALAASFDRMTDTLRAKEEALSTSEMRYRRLFEEAQDGILLLDAEAGEVINVNPYLVELLGYSHEQIIGKPIWELGTLKDIVPDRDSYLELQRQEYIRYDDLPLTTGDGRQIYVEFISNSYIVGQNKLIQCNIRNTTERKRAEEKLRLEEQRFRALADQSSDIIVLVNQEGKIIYENSAIESILGLKPEERIGASVFERLHPDDLKLVTDAFNTLSTNSKAPAQRAELRLRHKDGSWRTFETVGSNLVKDDIVEAVIINLRDITERKRSENILSESESKLRTIFEAVTDAVFVFDMNGFIREINRAGCEMHGYIYNELIGTHGKNLSSPESHKQFADYLLTVKKGQSFSVEAKDIRKDGTTFDIEARGVPIVWNGELHLLGVVRDITERKKAEEALRESERKMRSLTENSPDIIMIIDREGKLLFINRAEGRTVEELLGVTCYDYISPEYRHEYIETAERVFQTGKPDQIETRGRNQKNLISWWDTRFVPLESNGEIRTLMLIATDITQRKEAEEALRESEERLKILFEYAPDAYILSTLDGTIVDANRRAFELTGYSMEEVIGKTFLSMGVVSLEQFDVGTATAVHRSDKPFEMIVNRKDGTKINFETKTFTIEVKGSALLLSIARDITERKRAEEELIKYKDHLEELVKERTSQLDAAKLTAEQANKAKSDFLANMSHEIRTPLSTIIGFSELLYDETKGPLNNDQKKYIGYVTSAGEHLLSLINDILDLSKVEAGKMELLTTKFSVSDLLKNSLSFIAEKALKHNIKLLSEISSDVDMIEADERKVKQILYNLLSNAVKFTPDGGSVTIGAKLVKPDSAAIPSGIRKGLRNTEYVLISVKDTGIGIAKKDQAKLFTEFYQIEEPYAKKYEGTGLGLALSKRLVTLHGGKIWFESKGQGKGSTFYFILPLKPLPKT